MKQRVRRFTAYVSFRDHAGVEQEEVVPVQAARFDAAQELALRYVLQVLKLQDFELRIAGA